MPHYGISRVKVDDLNRVTDVLLHRIVKGEEGRVQGIDLGKEVDFSSVATKLAQGHEVFVLTERGAEWPGEFEFTDRVRVEADGPDDYLESYDDNGNRTETLMNLPPLHFLGRGGFKLRSPDDR